MRTKHIPSAQWRETFDDLSRAFDGSLVSLEVVGDEIGAQSEVVDQALQGISSDPSGVTICIARPQTMHLEHRVPNPKEVRIVETDEGAVMAVEIEESEGTHTLLRFRSPARPELFDPAVE
jgi:hypothetical protein